MFSYQLFVLGNFKKQLQFFSCSIYCSKENDRLACTNGILNTPSNSIAKHPNMNNSAFNLETNTEEV